MRPIPKSWLKDDAALYDVILDPWQHQQDELVTTLHHVRGEPTRARLTEKDNTVIQCDLVLFFDRVSSQPADVVFKLGQAVRFHNERYIISRILDLHDKHKPHHIELEMVLNGD